VIYPLARDIQDWFANLTPEQRDEFEPFIEEGQRKYRRAFQEDFRDQKKLISVLCEVAAEVFISRAAKRLLAHAGKFEEFQRAIGMDAGDAEWAFWCAHRVFNIVDRGRMLWIWHRPIDSHLSDLIREAENLWYTPDLVPERWKPFLGTCVRVTVPVGAAIVPASPPSALVNGGPGNAQAASAQAEPCWESMEICFLSEERVQIKTGCKSETRNYAEMGFDDRRNGKPDRAWAVLRVLAEKRGMLVGNREAGTDWKKVERRVQEIRKRLLELYPAAGDPIPFKERDAFLGRESGYHARFRIYCGPSYNF
jgi:hypothetical protein